MNTCRIFVVQQGHGNFFFEPLCPNGNNNTKTWFAKSEQQVLTQSNNLFDFSFEKKRLLDILFLLTNALLSFFEMTPLWRDANRNGRIKMVKNTRLFLILVFS